MTIDFERVRFCLSVSRQLKTKSGRCDEIRLLWLNQAAGELRFNPYHDPRNGRFTSGGISAQSVDFSGESGIMNAGSDKMAEITILGKLNIQPLEAEFGKLKTDEIVVTNERIDHIKNRHPNDFSLFEQYGVETVKNPDSIIKDCKNNGTVFMVKKLENTNLNVVVRLVLNNCSDNLKNSIMTFYRLRDKNLKKLEKNNKVLYKKE